MAEEMRREDAANQNAAELNGTKGKGKLVLLAMDDSEESFEGLSWVLDNVILRRSEPDEDSDEVVLLHAQHIQHINTSISGPGIITPELIETLEKQEEEVTQSILERATKLCHERNVKTRTIVKAGDPRDHLCEAVQELHADILVIGNHGHGTIKRVLLGTVSDYCVHNAKCHVVIVKKL